MKRDFEHNLDEWIAAALLGGLTTEEQADFQQFLNQNPQARKRFEETKTMTTYLENSLAPDRPDDAFENRMISGFRRRRREGPSYWSMLRSWIRIPAVYIPATAAVLIGLVQVGSQITHEPMPAPDFKGRVSGTRDNKDMPVSETSAAGPSGQFMDADELKLGMADEKSVRGLSESQAQSIKGFTQGWSEKSGPTGARKDVKNEKKLGEERSRQVAANAPQPSTAPSVPRDSRVEPLAKVKADQSPMRVDSVGDKLATPPSESEGMGLPDNRKLIRNASVDLEVTNYGEAVRAIEAIARSNSGYLATQSSTKLANGKNAGTIIIKVLPERLDYCLQELRGLGDLKNQSISTRDVTKEYFDTDARLRNARKMEDRLIELLETVKGKVSELLAVEKELGRVREQIEQMQGELKLYDALTQFATVTINLREKDLHEPAAFLLRETVNLSLFSTDVEKTYETARREAAQNKAQIVQSRLDRNTNGTVTAVLALLVEPDAAFGFVERLKSLGRVQNYQKEDQRVARDGVGNSDTAKVERDKVRVDLQILPDDESRRQLTMTVVAPEVETAFESAKSAAQNLGAQVITSRLESTTRGRGAATLVVRAPANKADAVIESLKKLGRVSAFQVRREDAGDETNGPVLITLSLTDQEAAVQFTEAFISTPDVEEKGERLKTIAAENKVEVVASTFSMTPDGRQSAEFVLRLPLADYARFFSELEKLGEVKNLSIRRNDGIENASNQSPAEISLRIGSPAPVVARDGGLGATLRKTFTEAVGAILWSVRMIGVAAAFFAPWLTILAIIVLVARRIFRKTK